MNTITTLTPAEAAARVREIADDVWYRYGHLLANHAGSGVGNPHFVADPSGRGGPKRDLRGMRFGMLVAIEPAGVGEWGGWRWHCRCDCGGESTPYAGSLLAGNSKSCGCQRNRQPGRLVKSGDLTAAPRG